MGFDMQAIVWLVLLVVLLAIEAVTLGLTTIWFAGGALVAFVLALAGAGLFIQIAVRRSGILGGVAMRKCQV